MIGTLKDRLRITILEKCGWDYSLALEYVIKEKDRIISTLHYKHGASTFQLWWNVVKMYASLQYEFLYQIDMRNGVYK